MEKLDVYDKNGNKTGRIIERGNKNLNDNEFIKLAIVYIKCKDKYLVQKTSANKGGDYAVTGGHVTSGNTSKMQAVIEAQEELGIQLKIDAVKFLGNIVKGHGIFDIFLVEDNTLEDFKFILQKEEVESVCWLTKNQINKLIHNNLFRPSSCEHYNKYIK